MGRGWGRSHYDPLDNSDGLGAKKKLAFLELLYLMRPYFWPSEGSDGAILNRIRATSTWFSVALSKVTSLISPFYLATAANALTNKEYRVAIKNIIIYVALRIASTIFKELQSLIYVKVKQQAGIELQEVTFRHLHTLSLNWHVSKKTGSVMKSMDRGIDGVTTLVTYLFLFLVPALLECFAVILLFFLQFKQWGLGLALLIGIILYIISTFLLTEWRKNLRKATNVMDNDYHDKATDSILNYETVKYFTAETYEVYRFKQSVIAYQQYSATTSMSASLLNITQQIILWATMLSAMIISGYAVICGQLTLGSWIAVQSWVSSIFTPLNFLGVIYASVTQAVIDITNLSQLLSEEPDVRDEPHAPPIPIANPLLYTIPTSVLITTSATSSGGSSSSSSAGGGSGDSSKGGSTVGTEGSNSSSNGISITPTTTKKKKDQVAIYIPFFTKSSDKKVKSTSKNKTKNRGDLESPLIDDDDDDNEHNTDHKTSLFPSPKTLTESPNSQLHPREGVSVTFNHVSFNYPAQLPDQGLQDISFHVPAGSTTAIVGHTGSGKTTISRLLFRFYDPLQGFITLNNYNIKLYTQQSVRSCIGIVPQDTVLFNDTILYNIQYGNLTASFADIEKAAESAQIKEFIEKLPQGWNTKVGERGLKLSGGEKQRVAIARCLLKDPPVVLLDEATSALDTVTEHSVQQALNNLGVNRTVIIIAHRLSTIRNADQIIVLEKGKLIERGTHEELLEQQQEYAKLWNMQIHRNSDTNNNNTLGSTDNLVNLSFNSNTASTSSLVINADNSNNKYLQMA